MCQISKEAAEILAEIINHEDENDYWEKRFSGLSVREDAILRGCFKELQENGYVDVFWADNHPYVITITKDGYTYHNYSNDENSSMKSEFESELEDLLNQAGGISAPNRLKSSMDNLPADKWMNDVHIFFSKYLKEHVLADRISKLLTHRVTGAFQNLVSCLESIKSDKEFITKMNNAEKSKIFKNAEHIPPEYDVFLSHANADKSEIVEELNESLRILGIKVFYDKDSLEWGDNWKQRILDGVKKAEFAIIVISENFFGREWTEIELRELLNRQNENGQKLILPIIHKITNEQLRERYPRVADIQTIDSSVYTSDKIALLFARQLIKRLKNII